MAVAKAQNTVKSVSNSSSSPFTSGSITTSAGNLVIAGVCLFSPGGGNPLCTQVVFDGVTNTTPDIHKQHTVTTDSHMYLFSFPNVSAGAKTASVTVTRPERCTIFLVEVSGAATSSVADGVGASAQGNSMNPASGNFTSTNTEILFANMYKSAKLTLLQNIIYKSKTLKDNQLVF